MQDESAPGGQQGPRTDQRPQQQRKPQQQRQMLKSANQDGDSDDLAAAVKLIVGMEDLLQQTIERTAVGEKLAGERFEAINKKIDDLRTELKTERAATQAALAATQHLVRMVASSATAGSAMAKLSEKLDNKPKQARQWSGLWLFGLAVGIAATAFGLAMW